MPQLSDGQIADVAFQAGFRSVGLQMAIAVCLAESGGNSDSTNQNSNGSTDRGLWQINSIHTEYDVGRLFDPAYNAQAAYQISGGGNNWQPWSSFTNGRYRQFMDRAIGAAAGKPVNGPSGPILPPGGGATPDIPPPTPPTIDLGYMPHSTLDGIQVEGLTGATASAMDEAKFSGTVDLTSTETSEMTVRFLDPQSGLVAANFIDVGVGVRWRDLDLRCKEFGPVDSDGLMAYELIAAARAVEELKQLTIANPPTGVSPTQLLAGQCAKVGLRFYGQGSPVGIEVQQVERPNGTKSNETVWEYSTRRAGELGFWLFESAGTVWFAKPSWLVIRTTRIRLGWNGAWGDERLDVLGVPVCRSVASPDGQIVTTVRLQVPRVVGEQVRPGMGLELKGVDPPHLTIRPPDTLFPDNRTEVEKALDAVKSALAPPVGPPTDGTIGGLIKRTFPRTRGFDRLYVVTKVSWDIGGIYDPVTIEATEPTDPAAKGISGAIDSVLEQVNFGGGTGSPGAFVQYASTKIGKAYVWGGESDAEGGFDCSGLVQWAAQQMGISLPRTAEAQRQACQQAGRSIPLATGVATLGALLFGSPSGSGAGHVAISLGNGKTIEAKGRAYGVGEFSASGRSFYEAGLVPGLSYARAGGVDTNPFN